MSDVRVTALDTHDKHFEGEEYEIDERKAQQLVRKGLVKIGPVPQNKMAAPSENKTDPSAAGGEAQRSSASPAAQASAQTTAKPSVAGKKAPAKKATTKATKRPYNRKPKGE